MSKFRTSPYHRFKVTVTTSDGRFEEVGIVSGFVADGKIKLSQRQKSRMRQMAEAKGYEVVGAHVEQDERGQLRFVVQRALSKDHPQAKKTKKKGTVKHKKKASPKSPPLPSVYPHPGETGGWETRSTGKANFSVNDDIGAE